MSDHIHQFRQAIEAAGLPAPAEVIDDSKLHRFSTNSKPSKKSGWYVLYGDDVPAGSFGCWSQGFTSKWCAKSDREMSASERHAMQERFARIKRQREAEELRVNEEAAAQAVAIWKAAPPANEKHGYIARKGIQPHGTKMHSDGRNAVQLRLNGIFIYWL